MKRDGRHAPNTGAGGPNSRYVPQQGGGGGRGGGRGRGSMNSVSNPSNPVTNGMSVNPKNAPIGQDQRHGNPLQHQHQQHGYPNPHGQPQHYGHQYAQHPHAPRPTHRGPPRENISPVMMVPGHGHANAGGYQPKLKQPVPQQAPNQSSQAIAQQPQPSMLNGQAPPIQFGTVGQTQAQMPVRTASAPPAEHPDQTQRSPIYTPFRANYQMGTGHSHFNQQYSHHQQHNFQHGQPQSAPRGQVQYQSGRGTQQRMRTPVHQYGQHSNLQAQQYYGMQQVQQGYMQMSHPMHPNYMHQQYQMSYHLQSPQEQQRPKPIQRERKALVIVDPKTNMPIKESLAAEQKAKASVEADEDQEKEEVKPVETTPSLTENPAADPKEAATTLSKPTETKKEDSQMSKDDIIDSMSKLQVSEITTTGKKNQKSKDEAAVVKDDASARPSVEKKDAEELVFGSLPTPIEAPRTLNKQDVEPKGETPASTVSPKSSKKTFSPKKTPKDLTKNEKFTEAAVSKLEEAPEVPKLESVPKETEEPEVQPTAPTKKVQSERSPPSDGDKYVYSSEFLLSLKDDITELPESARGAESGWKTMEIVIEGPARAGRSNSRGNSGGSGWERGISQPQNSRQNSTGRGGNTAGNTSGGGNSWARSQDLPRRQSGRKGGRGGGRGQQQNNIPEGPFKPLEKTDNRWVPSKSTGQLDKHKKTVQGIMNKMTREKFKSLSQQLSEMKMESLEIIRSVINLIFDKAIGEPHFCDMYADLCVVLQASWQIWDFLKVVVNDDEDGQFYWIALSDLTDLEVVGPFDYKEEALKSVDCDEVRPCKAPSNLELQEVRIRNGLLVKFYVSDEQKIYWSGENHSDLGEDFKIHGPYRSGEEAKAQASKQTSFKRILLNSCQEEFEKDNIYETLDKEIEEAKENDDQVKLTDLEEEKGKIKRRMLGNIRFIGELFKKGMLQERIMHECIMKLLGLVHSSDQRALVALRDPKALPDDENIESLCKLLTTVGIKLDKPSQYKAHFDACFNILKGYSTDNRMCSRIRFMIRDVVDLRQNSWEPRRKELKQKTLEEIRKDAEREQQRPSYQNNPRGPGGNSSNQPMRTDRRGDMPQRNNQRRDRDRDQNPFRFSQGSSDRRQHNIPIGGAHSENKSSRLGPQSGFSSMRQQGQSSLKPRGMPFGGMRKNVGPGQSSAPSQFDKKSPGRGKRFPSPGPGHRRSQSPNPSVRSTPSVVRQQPENLEKLKQTCKSIITEFIGIKDLNEAIACFKEKIQGEIQGSFVMADVLVQMVLDCKEQERDQIIQLMHEFYKKDLFSVEDFQRGVNTQLAQIDELKYDIPKVHVHLGTILARLAASSKPNVSFIDWLLRGEYIKDVEELQMTIESGIIEKVVGEYISRLRELDEVRARKEVRQTNINFTQVFGMGSFKESSAEGSPPACSHIDMLSFIKNYNLESVFSLKDAIEIAEKDSKGVKCEEIIKHIESNIAPDQRADTFFSKYACLFLLTNSLKMDGGVPSKGQCSLIRGLCADLNSQVELLTAMEQSFEKKQFSKLFEYLYREQVVTDSGWKKWKESKGSFNAIHKDMVAEANFLQQGLK